MLHLITNVHYVKVLPHKHNCAEVDRIVVIFRQLSFSTVTLHTMIHSMNRARPDQNLAGCFSNQQMCMCLFLWQSSDHLQRRKENQQCAACCSEVISDCHKFWLTGDPQNANKRANKGQPYTFPPIFYLLLSHAPMHICPPHCRVELAL